MDLQKDKKEKVLISTRIDNFLSHFYNVYKFIAQFFKEVLFPPYEFTELTRQCYQVGYKSLFLISLTSFITGIVFTKQSRPSLQQFGAESWLPNLIGIAIVRALAPLVTALICAGKVGSNIGAELGSMKVTEQIDAMEVSATNPFKFLVVTRILATTLTIPILAIYSGLISLLGSFVNVNQREETSLISFFQSAFSSISFLDLFSSLLKVMLFGFTVGAVGCYYGYHASEGTEGVGKAANTAVVAAMFLIFLEEILVVQIVTFLR